MNEKVLDLVDAIAQGDALQTEKAFQAAMAEKLSVKLDDMRAQVAQNMFASEQEEPEAVVEEEVEEDVFDLVEEFISEEEYGSLTEEEQEDYVAIEQLDELMGKGSLAAIKKAHDDASSGRTSPVQQFHSTQAGRAAHIMSKQSTREKHGKDAQHYHEYGSSSKRAKEQYAKLGKSGKAKVAKNLGKDYSGKDMSPGKATAGKTTIRNPDKESQKKELAQKRTETRKKFGLPQLDQDK
jgi:hypothetical protein